MLRVVLTYLWTAMIVACPVVCQARDLLCAQKSGAVSHSCCACCGGHEQGSGQNTPREKSPAPGRCSNCLCGGAVVHSLWPVELLNDAYSYFSPWTTADSLGSQVDLVRGEDAGLVEHLLPDSGRALRIRIESFLI